MLETGTEQRLRKVKRPYRSLLKNGKGVLFCIYSALSIRLVHEKVLLVQIPP